MSDPLRKVSPGEPLAIPAQAWNSMIDAVKRVRGLSEGAGYTWPDGARVRNATSGPLPVWAVVELTGPAVPPAVDGGQELQEGGVLDGGTPTGALTARLAVLQAPAEPGEIVEAVTDGLTVALLASYDSRRRYAWAQAGSVAALASADAGWEVVWADTGGSGLAVVRAGPLVSLHMQLVRVTSPTPDPDTGLYDAYLVYWDAGSGTWVDGPAVWVRDLNP